MDKRQTQLRYDIYLSEDRSRVERIKLVTAAAAKPEGQAGRAKPSPTALTSDEHVAFHYEYTFSEENAIQPYDVPPEAAKLLE